MQKVNDMSRTCSLRKISPVYLKVLRRRYFDFSDFYCQRLVLLMYCTCTHGQIQTEINDCKERNRPLGSVNRYKKPKKIRNLGKCRRLDFTK